MLQCREINNKNINMDNHNIQFEDILDLAIEKNASDLHVSVNDPIALRIYGKLHFVEQKVDQLQMEKIIESFLTKTQTKQLEQQKKILFVYTYGEKMRFRVSVFYQLSKLSLAIHSIDNTIMDIESLAISSILKNLINLQSGIVLITGEHNNGVSTTTRSMLQHLNKNKARHIFTVENPVEYYFKSEKSLFSQCEIFNDIDSYSKGLETAFDVDADIVFVDNAYGVERFKTILNLAETGHLVIAILPKTGVVSALESLIHLFPTEKHAYIQTKLANTLRGVISQKLLPRKDQDGFIPAFEALTVNSNIANLIKSGSIAQLKNAMQSGISQGMITMEMYVNQLLEEGYIDESEHQNFIQED